MGPGRLHVSMITDGQKYQSVYSKTQSIGSNHVYADMEPVPHHGNSHDMTIHIFQPGPRLLRTLRIEFHVCFDPADTPSVEVVSMDTRPYFRLIRRWVRRLVSIEPFVDCQS